MLGRCERTNSKRSINENADKGELECAYSTVGLQGKAMPPMISVGGWCESLGELVKRTSSMRT